jgi:hypothetical protein
LLLLECRSLLHLRMHLRAFEAQAVMRRRPELEDALMSRPWKRLRLLLLMLLLLLMRCRVEARLLLEAQQRLVLLHDRGRAAASDRRTYGSSGTACTLALALPSADVSAGSHAGGERMICVRQLALCVRAVADGTKPMDDAGSVRLRGLDPVHVSAAWISAEALPLRLLGTSLQRSGVEVGRRVVRRHAAWLGS